MQRIRTLRRSLSPTQAAEVVQQVSLRRRAARKFSRASQMFFTQQGLPQATDERTACYKATQFPTGPLVDLCCGIGGDLAALALDNPTLGVDLDEQCARMARKNCEVLGRQVSVIRMRAEQFSVAEFTAWHADPDRRALKPRSSQLDYSVPTTSDLDRALAANIHAGIKLAPAAQIPSSWSKLAEAEWIGEQDECRQLFLRFGILARGEGIRTATLVDCHGQMAGQIRGGDQSPFANEKIPGYIYEPHACVRAARLVDELAGRHGLWRVSVDAPYLAGESLIRDRLLAAFVVDEVLPFDLRRVKQAVRHRGWGRLEVKKRGCSVQPELLMRKLRVAGDGQGVVLVSPRGRNLCAILAQRAETPIHQ